MRYIQTTETRRRAAKQGFAWPPANYTVVVAKVLGLLLLAVIAAALVWGAAEQHYQSCVQARFVAGTGKAPPNWSTSGCSRSPF
jgi:hypothetical protein